MTVRRRRTRPGALTPERREKLLTAFNIILDSLSEDDAIMIVFETPGAHNNVDAYSDPISKATKYGLAEMVYARTHGER